ncbi:MAG: ATP-binding protein [Candidatus Marsarchaeota archaeon]|jgi:predicted AAA+ superfamily ATPase|nr:ATP-binding protein [Candidatus Marsarchaeota archaeon]
MEIEQLASQNPWWSNKDSIKKDDKVKKVLETKEKIQYSLSDENQVLIGPRQLGKTTALKYDIYKKIILEDKDPSSIMYYSFDTVRDFEVIKDVLNTFVTDENKKYIYLDEVSFVNEWQRAVKQFLDIEKSKNVVLYITGSSSINLKKELMPGRKIKFLEFLPLSFRDFLLSFGSEPLKRFIKNNRAEDFRNALNIAHELLTYFNEISKWFNIYIKTGGYPDAIFDYLGKGRISDDIYDTHWNAFISDISRDNKSVEIATAIIYGIVESYSSKINLSNIARMQGIKSHVTVREYLETFDNLFISKSIFPNADKKYVFRKERKVYFNDPFLYNLFAKKINLLDRNSESKIVEGILFNHLYRFINKNKTITEPKTSIGFYSGKREVDFVINNFGFEVKWQNEVNKTDFPNIELKNKILLSKKTLEIENTNGVTILPLPLFISIL